MSKILVRSIANIGKLMKNVKNVPLKSNTLISCNVKCVPSMMQSFGRSYASKAEQSLAKYCEKVGSWGRESFYLNYIGEFDVQKQDGTDVELFRKYKDEKITIKFNINGSLKYREIPNSEYDPDWDDEDDPYVEVSQPLFTVEINKDKEKNLLFKLAFKCSEEGEKNEQYYPDVDIVSFTISKIGEFDNTAYSIFGKNMNENVRSNLRTMLQERGVDHQFLYDLRDWADDYGKELKIEILKGLHKHVM